jgi:TIR domain
MGEDWREKIRQAIGGNALAFVACFSAAGLARDRSYQQEELVLAVDELRRRRPGVPWLIPVRLDDCQIPDLPLGGGRTLRQLQRADVFGERREHETARLVSAITRILMPLDERLLMAATVSGDSGIGDAVSRAASGDPAAGPGVVMWGETHDSSMFTQIRTQVILPPVPSTPQVRFRCRRTARRLPAGTRS